MAEMDVRCRTGKARKKSPLHGARVAVWRPSQRKWCEGTVLDGTHGGLWKVAFPGDGGNACHVGRGGGVPAPAEGSPRLQSFWRVHGGGGQQLEEAYSEAILRSGHPHIKILLNGEGDDGEAQGVPRTSAATSSSSTCSVDEERTSSAAEPAVVPFLRAWKPPPSSPMPLEPETWSRPQAVDAPTAAGAAASGAAASNGTATRAGRIPKTPFGASQRSARGGKPSRDYEGAAARLVRLMRGRGTTGVTYTREGHVTEHCDCTAWLHELARSRFLF